VVALVRRARDHRAHLGRELVHVDRSEARLRSSVPSRSTEREHAACHRT
jgi:hypothetical protein